MENIAVTILMVKKPNIDVYVPRIPAMMPTTPVTNVNRPKRHAGYVHGHQ